MSANGSSTVRIILENEFVTLGSSASYFGALDRAWMISARIAVGGDAVADVGRAGKYPNEKYLGDAFRRRMEDVDVPHLRFSQQSNPWIELGMELAKPAPVGVGVGLATLGTLAYVVRHVEHLGGAIPNLVASWHEGWKRAADAKAARLDQSQVERDFRSLEEDLTKDVRLIEHMARRNPIERVETEGVPDLRALPTGGAGDQLTDPPPDQS